MAFKPHLANKIGCDFRRGVASKIISGVGLDLWFIEFGLICLQFKHINIKHFTWGLNPYKPPK